MIFEEGIFIKGVELGILVNLRFLEDLGRVMAYYLEACFVLNFLIFMLLLEGEGGFY